VTIETLHFPPALAIDRLHLKFWKIFRSTSRSLVLSARVEAPAAHDAKEKVMIGRTLEKRGGLKVEESPTRPTVSVVADDQGFRSAVTFQLTTAGFDASAYPSAESFLESQQVKESDCVVADLYLPRMNGLQLLGEIKHSKSCTHIVFLTGCADISCGVQAMRDGAVDYLQKPADDQRLLNAVMRAVELSLRKRAENSKQIELRHREETLTPRERQVFALVTAGLLNKQVGATLGATERTIKTHRGRVMDKMNADSVAELVRMADLLQIHSRATVSDGLD
jgi:two-component system response regulator FixJ